MLLTAAAAAGAAAAVDTAAAAGVVAGGDGLTCHRATADVQRSVALAAAAAGSAAAAAEPRGGTAQALLAAAASAAALQQALAAVSLLGCSALQLHVLHLLDHCLPAAVLQRSGCTERSTPPLQFAGFELGSGSTCDSCIPRMVDNAASKIINV